MSATILSTAQVTGIQSSNYFDGTFSVVAGSGLLLGICTGYEWATPDAIASVVLDPDGASPQTLTQLQYVAHAISNARRHYVFALPSVATTQTTKIRVTMATNPTQNDRCYMLLRGIEGQDAVGMVRDSTGTQTTMGNGTNSSNTITAQTGDLVVDFCFVRDEVSYISAAAGQGSVTKWGINSGNTYGSSTKPGAASVTTQWLSSDVGALYDASLIQVAIRSAAGVSLTGLGSNFAQGSLGYTRGGSHPLTGVAASFGLGSMLGNAPGAAALTGVPAAFALGTLGVTRSSAQALTGLAANFAIGSMGATNTGASFTTEALMNNTESLLASTSIAWEWHRGGVIGSAVGTVTYGVTTTNSSGVLVAAGMAPGAGYLLAADAAGHVFYQAGTAA